MLLAAHHYHIQRVGAVMSQRSYSVSYDDLRFARTCTPSFQSLSLVHPSRPCGDGGWAREGLNSFTSRFHFDFRTFQNIVA
jgi:hypothetical protein